MGSLKRRQRQERVQTGRLARALALTAVLVAALAIACLVPAAQTDASGSTQEDVQAVEKQSYLELLGRQMEAGEGAQDLLADMGYEAVGDEVPEWFEQEVVSSAVIEEGVANADWSVVGFLSDLQPDEAIGWLADTLAEKGWAGYESGVDGVATFSKKGGRCAWIMASCTRVDDATSVVMSIYRR